MSKLNSTQVKAALGKLPDWKRKGSVISRTYVLKDFPAAVRFVNAVAKVAEKAWHHPDIDIRWNKVTLALTTHDEGGLTEKDFKLAGSSTSYDGAVANSSYQSGSRGGEGLCLQSGNREVEKRK